MTDEISERPSFLLDINYAGLGAFASVVVGGLRVEGGGGKRQDIFQVDSRTHSVLFSSSCSSFVAVEGKGFTSTHSRIPT